MADKALEEIKQFLGQDTRNDLQLAACTVIRQLTGSPSGVTALCKNHAILESIVNLITATDAVAKVILETLVNVSAEEDGAESLLSLETNIVDAALKCIGNKEFNYADLACAILANICNTASLSDKVLCRINGTQMKLFGIVKIFCEICFNKKGCGLHLLANVLSNISQTAMGRETLMNKEDSHLSNLLPFVGYDGSPEDGRRKSIIQMVHNCCFEKEHHEWLIDEMDILSRLLLPLAGPDVFTEEENDSLPVFLQYLPDDKSRETDIEIRLLLLESVYKFCMTRICRQKLRDNNVYLIMREYHNWEKNKKLLTVTEDIVNFLIRKEEEILCDDMSTVEVPEDMVKKFNEEQRDTTDLIEDSESARNFKKCQNFQKLLNPTKMAGRLTVHERAQIAAHYEV